MTVSHQTRGRGRRARRAPGWRRLAGRAAPGPTGSAAVRNAPYYALAAVCVGAFMGQLDASIVTVAFPTLERASAPASAR